MSDDTRTGTGDGAASPAETRRAAVLAAAGVDTAFWNNIVAHMQDGFSLVDADGVHVDVNPAFCAMTGFSRDELVGSGLPHVYWPTEEVGTIEAAFSQAVQGVPETFALTFRRKDGERFPALVTPAVIRDPAGAVVAVFATVKDMTALQRAQEALAISEERYRLLLQNMNDAVYVHEIDAHGPGPIIDVNERACEMLGYAREELLAMEVGALDVHEQEERLPRIMAALREDGRAVFETEHITKDGRRLPVEVSVRMLEIGGRSTVLSVARNVSERRRIHEALRENEERLRTVLLAAHGGIALQARDGRILVWNETAEKMFGASGSEVIGESALEREWGAIHEDGSPWPPAEHPSMQTLASGEPQRDVVMGVRRGDQLSWIAIATQPLRRDGQTEPYAVVISFEDISARRLAERALRENEAKYRAVADGTTDGIVIARGPDLVFANAAFAQMSGYTLEELEGFPFLEMVQEDQRAVIAARVRRRLAGEDVPGTYDIDLVSKGGDMFSVAVRADVIDYLGAPADLVIMRDVTKRRRLERQLEDERQRYKLLVENSGEAVLLTQPDGVILSANPAACRMFGRHEEEIRGLGRAGLVDLTDPRLAVGLKERDRAGSFAGGLRFVRADGSTFEAEVSSSIYTDHAGALKTSMIVRDVTDRRRAEDEIRRLNAELERRVVSSTTQRDAVTRELEAFAYSASHDLRAPLRAIDGFSAMVLEDAAGVLTPEDVHHLQRVREAAQRMGRLIDDLLGLSRLARRDLEREPVDLSALAVEVAAEVRAEHPGQTVDLVIASGLEAEADQPLLRVILRSLLDNAWKFTSGRETARVEVGASDADGEHAFFVRDDGAGFDASHAQHLFGVFQRMHTSEEFAGDGIGLAMVQRLVARHGGRCWAEAEVGKGATFFFTLPGPD